ncbi:unnamed protein product [Malassezia sympodialis ATCC 42132]|uniref:uncharacterized protein n=1 Tax=Malassezia sympodialis (strain ATCC 42132) TaxID=1230383 RepID=UPI0002C22967|nr:uncharacterized protein MSY001_2711 [Malassezia sympodialis ATCC 42132]CCV00006.1 unnamed protein product [Malassezia sympodialis ATCC 42132]|eukprot:XP_018741221.1 uncharacterized protein MSY001_2711 [Malassezia sympodialis ATCC 42132]
MPNVDAPSRSAVTVTESQEDAQVAEKVTSDFLVVILDLDKMTWMQVASQRASPEERAAAAYETLKNVISSVLVFLNAHIAMQSGNGLAVYGAAAGQACLLYTSSAHAPLLARSWRTQDTRVSGENGGFRRCIFFSAPNSGPQRHARYVDDVVFAVAIYTATAHVPSPG